jgi:hypothetical protein
MPTAVGISVTSPHFTIAALCNVRLSLLGPPKPVTIIAVNAIITQTFEVHYKDGRIARPKPQNFVLAKVDSKASPSLTVAIHNPATCCVNPGVPIDDSTSSTSSSLSHPPLDAPKPRPPVRPSVCCTIEPDTPLPDPSPLIELQAGQEFVHSRVCRVPTDDFVRASTGEFTETCIRVSHRCSVEVRYTVEGKEEEMLLTMGKPVTITSWCVSLPLFPKPPVVSLPSALLY